MNPIPPVTKSYQPAPPLTPLDSKEKNISIAVSFGIILLVAVVLAFVIGRETNSDLDGSHSLSSDHYDEYDSDYYGECNVLGIPLYGTIDSYTYGEDEQVVTSINDVEAKLDLLAASDHGYKAVWVEVDSYGGRPVAGAEIAALIDNASIPVVAQVRSAAASAAYWSISSADYIIAHPYSDVGGIGVTASYIDYEEYNQERGITFNSISSGDLKDMGNIEKSLTEAERQYIQAEVDLIHEGFVTDVATYRGLPAPTITTLVNGATVLGVRAVELGLVDELGGKLETQAYLESLIEEPVNVCWN